MLIRNAMNALDDSSRTNGIVAAAVQWTERIMFKIDAEVGRSGT